MSAAAAGTLLLTAVGLFSQLVGFFYRVALSRMLGAEAMGDDHRIELKEVVLKHHNPWNDRPIRELDISRQTVIVMVKRRGTMLIPNGDLILKEGTR